MGRNWQRSIIVDEASHSAMMLQDARGRRASRSCVPPPRARTTIIAAPTAPTIAVSVADSVIFLDEGRIVAQGSPRELLAAYDGKTIATISGAAPFAPSIVAQLAGLDGVAAAEVEMAGAVVAYAKSSTLVEIMKTIDAAGGKIAEVHVAAPDLAACFRDATGHALRDGGEA